MNLAVVCQHARIPKAPGDGFVVVFFVVLRLAAKFMGENLPDVVVAVKRLAEKEGPSCPGPSQISQELRRVAL
ncbi:MAG TPA: hypothetical protein VET48_12945 [Steroidobacteraceae bacterium]|nr:hypothetical protein [Steroidobacteraceae bacterium]